MLKVQGTKQREMEVRYANKLYDLLEKVYEQNIKKINKIKDEDDLEDYLDDLFLPVFDKWHDSSKQAAKMWAAIVDGKGKIGIKAWKTLNKKLKKLTKGKYGVANIVGDC